MGSGAASAPPARECARATGNRPRKYVIIFKNMSTKLTAASGRVLNGPANAVHTVAWPACSMSWKAYHPAPPEGVKSRADPTFGHSRTRLNTFTVIIRDLKNPGHMHGDSRFYDPRG